MVLLKPKHIVILIQDINKNLLKSCRVMATMDPLSTLHLTGIERGHDECDKSEEDRDDVSQLSS